MIGLAIIWLSVCGLAQFFLYQSGRATARCAVRVKKERDR